MAITVSGIIKAGVSVVNALDFINDAKGLINDVKGTKDDMVNTYNAIKGPIQSEANQFKYQLIKNSPSHNTQAFGQYASSFDYFGTYNDYIASQSAYRGIVQDNTTLAEHLADMYQKGSPNYIKKMMIAQDSRSNTSTTYMDRFR